MPLNIARQPAPQRLDSLRVRNPISAGHGVTWAQELEFLLGYCTERVGSTWLPNRGAASTAASYVYARSPGCRALLVACSLYPNTPGTHSKVTVTLGGAPCTWITAGGGGAPGRLDGSQDVYAPDGTALRTVPVIGLIDVSAVTVGALQELRFQSDSFSLEYIHAAELPIADADPIGSPTTEVGVLEPDTRDPIVDGTASVGYGLQRLLDQVIDARMAVRRHWNVAAFQDTSRSLQATTLAPAWVDSLTDVLLMRTRRLYASGTTNAYKLAVIYRTSGVGVAGAVRVRVKVNGVTTATDVALAASTSWTMVTAAVTITAHEPTYQLAEIEVLGQVAAAGTLYVGTLALVEDEV